MDHRQGLLWQLAMAEIVGHGPGTPDHGSCASSLEHWPFSVRVVDSLHGGLFAAIKFRGCPR
jgi:hypothetical protein